MKKIICYLFLFLTFSLNCACFAIQAESPNDYEKFKKSLNLNFWQARKIDKIETKTEAELKEICQKIRQYESDALLLKMKSAQLKNSDCNRQAANLYNSSRMLQKRANEVVKEKDKQILAVLSKSQKEKYIEYISRVY